MDNTVFKKEGMLWWVKVRQMGDRQTAKGAREGGRSTEQREGGNGDSDGHQMNKLWRAPFCRMGSQSPPSLSLSTPPSSAALLPSSLLSLTVQFPPLASLLLPANCEWSLIIGPPTRLRSELSQRLREETGMSKCYLRQQTARGTLRPNVHPKTHQRCAAPQRGRGREAQALAVLIQNPVCDLNIYTLCTITENGLHMLRMASSGCSRG